MINSLQGLSGRSVPFCMVLLETADADFPAFSGPGIRNHLPLPRRSGAQQIFICVMLEPTECQTKPDRNCYIDGRRRYATTLVAYGPILQNLRFGVPNEQV